MLWTVKKKKLHVLLDEVAVYLFDGMPNTGDGLFVFFFWTSFVEIAEKNEYNYWAVHRLICFQKESKKISKRNDIVEAVYRL